MINKKKIKVWFFGAFLGLIMGLILSNLNEFFSACEYSCDILIDSLGPSLGLLSFCSIIILIILLFLKDHVFLAWQKFAVFYLPIAFGLVILSSFADTGSGFGIGLFGYPDPETAAWWASGIFFIWSLVIIIKESLKLRGK